jgi:hypothetical protein
VVRERVEERGELWIERERERDTRGTYLQLSDIGGISSQRGCILGVEAS